jgi:thiamine biosynthesis lipoprotein
VTLVEQIMGMPIVLDVRDDQPDAGAIARMWDSLRRVDAVFSTYKEDSEISRLNRGELALEDASPEVREVLDRCEELRVETGGYFDARAAGDGVDPSGLVKGWAVDRACAVLDEAGFVNYALDAGGDIRLSGRAVPDLRWRVGIRHPRLADKLAAVVEGNELAIATSGEYERGQHVFDPHTHAPPSGVLSVTVTGPELATADAYATAAFAMGEAGPKWTARLPRRYAALTILADETVLTTGSFPRVS